MALNIGRQPLAFLLPFLGNIFCQFFICFLAHRYQRYRRPFTLDFTSQIRTRDLACLLVCASARARILFIRFLYAILVMPFVNTEAVVKIATLRVSGLSLTRIPTMLNDTPRVSKYFPMQPASPSELSLHFFSRSVCLLFTTRVPLTHSHGFRSFSI